MSGTSGSVQATIGIKGIDRFRALLRGLAAETQRNDNAAIAGSDRVTRKQISDAQRTGNARKAAEDAAHRQALSHLNAQTREETKTHRLRIRNLADLGRRARENPFFAAGVAAGAVGSAVGGRLLASGAAGGLRSQQETQQVYMQNRRSLIRTSEQVGMSGRVDEMQARVNLAAQASGLDSAQIVEALGAAQGRFGQTGFDQLYDSLTEFATAANATGASLTDMVGTVGEFGRQMGIVEQSDVSTLIGVLAETARQGSIEFADMSSSFAPLIGSFQRLTGLQGVEGATQFAAIAQSLGAGGKDASGTAILFQNLLSKLTDGGVQQRLERRLGNRELFDARGRPVGGLAPVMSALASANLTPQDMQRILGRDMEANAAAGILVGNEGTNNSIGTIAGSSASAGNAMIARTNANLMSDATGQAAQANARLEAAFAGNAQQLIHNQISEAEPLALLNAQYPIATERLGLFNDAVQAAVGALGSVSLLGGIGGGAAAAGAAGAGAAGTAAAAGGAGLLGAGALALLAPAAAYAIQDATGLDQYLGGLFAPEQALPRQERRGLEGPPTSRASDRYNQRRVIDQEAASMIGNAVANSIARGAPADGRTPGEPGRR
jgi:hypothetical protein